MKQLSAASHQGKNQFVTEIAIMSAVQHRNLVKLYGCCVEADKRHLVYEHLENKSLDQALFGIRTHLCFCSISLYVHIYLCIVSSLNFYACMRQEKEV